MICTVILLDGSVREWNLPNNATGQELLDGVYEHLNLLERDYFGLAIFDSPSTKTWLDVSKQINKQLKGARAQFVFSVKFYPTNPAQLCEDLTRYLLCLQLRQDLRSGRLPCPSVTLIALGSYVLQSEFGPYDPDLHGDAYINSLYLAPNQNGELLKRMRQRHTAHGSMPPEQADLLFLQNACELPLYGIDRHRAKDSSSEDVVLGVCSEGILIYRDDMEESKFLWPRVLKLSYRHSKFLLRTITSEGLLWTLFFVLPTNRACKSLWKVAVEHHCFFRRPTVEPLQRRLLSLHSQFRLRGRTEAQCLEENSEDMRLDPYFVRKPWPKTPSLNAPMHESQSESDDWFHMLDTIPPKPLYIPVIFSDLDDGPVLASEWSQGPDDWLLFDQPRSFLTPLDVPLSDISASQGELEQDVEGTSACSLDEEAMAESMVELVEEEEYVEDTNLEETQEDGEITEMRQVRRVKVVRKITRQFQSVQGTLLENKDIDITVKEQAERLRESYGMMDRMQSINLPSKDAERDDWHILFDRQPSLFYPTLAAKQWGTLAEQSTDMRHELNISREIKQNWQVVEQFQEKASDEAVEMGGILEIRQQTRRQIITIQTQEVKMELEGGELRDLKEDIMQEMQEQIDIIQENLQELVEVEERQMELDILKEKLQEVQMLEYQVQTMEQLKDGDTKEDDWYILLDRLPYIISPLPLVAGPQAYAVQSTHEPEEERILERTEQIVEKEQRIQAPDEPEGGPEKIISQAPSTMVRYIEDDWFVLFEQVALPEKTIIPVTWGNLEQPKDISPLQSDEESDMEEMEERMEWQEQEEIRGVLPAVEELRPTYTAKEVEDDWHMTLEVRPNETVRAVEPYTDETKKQVEVYQFGDEQTSFETTEVITKVVTTRVMTTEKRTEKTITIMEKRDMYADNPGHYIPTEEKRPVAVRDIEDDWYILLEPTPVEIKPSTTVPWQSGQPTRVEEDRGEERIVRREETTECQEQVMVVEVKKEVLPVMQDMRPQLTERPEEDDWYILLEPPPKEIVWVPPQLKVQAPVVRVEAVKRVRIAEKEATIIPEREELVQLPTVVVLQKPPPSVPRQIEDDWFLLFEPVPVAQKPQAPVEWQQLKAPTRVIRVTAEREEEEVRVEDGDRQQELVTVLTVAQPAVQLEKPSFTPRDLEDDWYTLLDLTPKKTVAVKVLPQKAVQWEERTTALQVIKVEEKRVIIDRPAQPLQPPKQPPPAVRDIDDDWFRLLDPIPLQERSIPSAEVRRPVDISQMKEERVVEAKPEGRILETPRLREVESSLDVFVGVREIEDDWFVLWDKSVPAYQAEIKPTVVPRPAEKPTAVEKQRMEQERLMEKERMREEDKRKRVTIVEVKKAPAIRPITDDWFILLERVAVETRAPPTVETRPVDKLQSVERESVEIRRVTEKERMREEELKKRVTVVEPKKAPAVRAITDDWFTLLTREPVETQAPPRMETRPAEKPRPMERESVDRRVTEKERMREEELKKRVTVVEPKKAPAVRPITDDWFILLNREPVEVRPPTKEKPKAVERERVGREKITERERMKKEEMRKKVVTADVKREPAIRPITDDWYILLDKFAEEALPKAAPIIPTTPPKRPVTVDRPMTSTPTVHPAPVVKYILKEEKIEEKKKVEVTVTDDEELTMIKRKLKKIEGENIYVRHSMLMLEDFDVTQEVVLRHHASISELKRLFMEAEPVAYTSEWDKHLSICHLDSHTLLISMEEWERDERISIM
ncbi:protein 4.1b isoform X4 [Engraulis encrasicolus]|uniref:protein 4.1b isoform X4 n=1 Tax=Engraulis encrasicolus TaxID=184585 RepID=UPI002FCED188